MRPIHILSCLAVALALGACASPPQSQYYTLSPLLGQTPGQVGHGAGQPAHAGQAAHAVIGTSASFAINVASVEIPQKVDRPQIVLNHADGTQVTLLNDSQWAAPLADEIRNALARDLSQRLGVLELEPRALPKDMPLWQFNVVVNRFESVYGRRAVLEATWQQSSLNEAKGGTGLCRALIEVPVQQGMPELVSGHQQALEKLADLMADRLSGNTLEAGPGVTLKGCV